jgi:hypothetical protein
MLRNVDVEALKDQLDLIVRLRNVEQTIADTQTQRAPEREAARERVKHLDGLTVLLAETHTELTRKDTAVLVAAPKKKGKR